MNRRSKNPKISVQYLWVTSPQDWRCRVTEKTIGQVASWHVNDACVDCWEHMITDSVVMAESARTIDRAIGLASDQSMFEAKVTATIDDECHRVVIRSDES